MGQAIAKHPTTDLILVGFADDEAEKQPQSHLEFPILGAISDVPRLVQEYELQEIIFSAPPSRHPMLRSLVMTLQDAPVILRMIPDAFDLVFMRAPIEEFEGIPITTLSEFPL